MLRLEPETQNPTVFVGVSSLVNEKTLPKLKEKFPDLTLVKEHLILPCKQNPLFRTGNLSNDLQDMSARPKILPYELVGKISSYFMNQNEVGLNEFEVLRVLFKSSKKQ
jgi:hypothetical protein